MSVAVKYGTVSIYTAFFKTAQRFHQNSHSFHCNDATNTKNMQCSPNWYNRGAFTKLQHVQMKLSLTMDIQCQQYSMLVPDRLIYQTKS